MAVEPWLSRACTRYCCIFLPLDLVLVWLHSDDSYLEFPKRQSRDTLYSLFSPPDPVGPEPSVSLLAGPLTRHADKYTHTTSVMCAVFHVLVPGAPPNPPIGRLALSSPTCKDCASTADLEQTPVQWPSPRSSSSVGRLFLASQPPRPTCPDPSAAASQMIQALAPRPSVSKRPSTPPRPRRLRLCGMS
ncbi:hypothetical protein CDD82_3934 [Ophiocordyceps australis]|uniref:Uncharacterized protein n=1 Tax=Ophiocordyceps australis TaxID=1399860 RepID=A0A2C5ZT43_9HYPO|nr:hypothetical protein CDD82_3934 [Ophiocordyceps australis]